MGFVAPEGRFNGPAVVVVLSQGSGFLLGHIEVRYEREPAHPVVGFEYIHVLVFHVLYRRLVALLAINELCLGIEELRERLLGVFGSVAQLTLVLTEQRHLGPLGLVLVAINDIRLRSERFLFVFPFVGVVGDVVLGIRDHEVGISTFQFVHAATAGKITVAEYEPDVAAAGLDLVQQVIQLFVNQSALNLEFVSQLERHSIGNRLSRQDLVGVVCVVQLLGAHNTREVRGLVGPCRDVGGVNRDRQLSFSK